MGNYGWLKFWRLALTKSCDDYISLGCTSYITEGITSRKRELCLWSRDYDRPIILIDDSNALNDVGKNRQPELLLEPQRQP
jgi:hypothetical protein